MVIMRATLFRLTAATGMRIAEWGACFPAQHDQQMLKEVYNACPARLDKFGSHVIWDYLALSHDQADRGPDARGPRAPELLEN